MSVLVVGMSHRSAPVALLERLSMDQRVREDTAALMVAKPSLSEAMIISTCNRMEVYTVTNSFHTGVQDVVDVLHEVSGVDEATLRGYLYVRYADAAAEHLMVVASGLDSMVIGEQQIIGQVRTAYQEASEHGTVGPALHSLAQTALHTGKRVHAETAIDDAGGSMVSFALDEALRHMTLGPSDAAPLAGVNALVLGAGAMASLAATHLGKLGVSRLIIANRTRERAERLAEHAREAGVVAEVIDFEDRFSVLSQVDIAVSATGADSFTITPAAIPSNRAPQLILVDLSLPRDIDDDVALLSGVHLVNIERLHQVHGSEDGELAPTTRAALSIVSEELEHFTSEQRVRDVVPAVAELRRHANEVADQELELLRNRVPALSEHDFQEAARAVRRVVDKLLHEPTVRVKKLAAESGVVSYESALQELFGLALAPLPEEKGRSAAVDLSDLPATEEITSTTPMSTAHAGRASTKNSKEETMAAENTQTERAGTRPLLLGTRGSALARTQAGHVRDALIAAGFPAELHIVTTAGDVNMAPVERIGVGVFTQALREALHEGECDVAIHSFKDLPSAPDPRFRLVVPRRADAREALIARDGLRLAELPEGATVGTSAPRRISQLRALRPDLDIRPLRGNIDTRMGKVTSGELDAVILAYAGLSRMGQKDRATEVLSVEDLLPAPAQGALAIECRADDEETVRAIESLVDDEATACATAERALLARLEAGCTAPVAAHATLERGMLSLTAGAFALDGSHKVVLTRTAPSWEAVALGRRVADELLDQGAGAILGGERN